jgi:carbamate kinase
VRSRVKKWSSSLAAVAVVVAAGGGGIFCFASEQHLYD